MSHRESGFPLPPVWNTGCQILLPQFTVLSETFQFVVVMTATLLTHIPNRLQHWCFLTYFPSWISLIEAALFLWARGWELYWEYWTLWGADPRSALGTSQSQKPALFSFVPRSGDLILTLDVNIYHLCIWFWDLYSQIFFPPTDGNVFWCASLACWLLEMQ